MRAILTAFLILIASSFPADAQWATRPFPKAYGFGAESNYGGTGRHNATPAPVIVYVDRLTITDPGTGSGDSGDLRWCFETLHTGYANGVVIVPLVAGIINGSGQEPIDMAFDRYYFAGQASPHPNGIAFINNFIRGRSQGAIRFLTIQNRMTQFTDLGEINVDTNTGASTTYLDANSGTPFSSFAEEDWGVDEGDCADPILRQESPPNRVDDPASSNGGARLHFKAANTVLKTETNYPVRFWRMAYGTIDPQSHKVLDFWGDPWGGNVEDVVVDHCSLSGGNDEVTSAGNGANRITWQYNIIREPIHGGAHREWTCGGAKAITLHNTMDQDAQATIFRNFVTHFNKRSPRISIQRSGAGAGGEVEVIENVFYNAVEHESFGLSSVDVEAHSWYNRWSGGPLGAVRLIGGFASSAQLYIEPNPSGDWSNWIDSGTFPYATYGVATNLFTPSQYLGSSIADIMFDDTSETRVEVLRKAGSRPHGHDNQDQNVIDRYYAGTSNGLNDGSADALSASDYPTVTGGSFTPYSATTVAFTDADGDWSELDYQLHILAERRIRRLMRNN